jgi:hypothetical protein
VICNMSRVMVRKLDQGHTIAVSATVAEISLAARKHMKRKRHKTESACHSPGVRGGHLNRFCREESR